MRLLIIIKIKKCHRTYLSHPFTTSENHCFCLKVGKVLPNCPSENTCKNIQMKIGTGSLSNNTDREKPQVLGTAVRTLAFCDSAHHKS